MSIFGGKNKLSFVAMERLIEETSKSNLDTVINLLSEMNIPFEQAEAKIIIIALNYELCRYELYKSNDKIDVNDLLEELYSQIFYGFNFESNEENKYQTTIDQIIQKMKEIFNVKKLMAPAEKFVYRLLLEQLSIKENTIEKGFISDLLFYATTWVNNAKGINNSYKIDIDEDDPKNEKIDFRF